MNVGFVVLFVGYSCCLSGRRLLSGRVVGCLSGRRLFVGSSFVVVFATLVDMLFASWLEFEEAMALTVLSMTFRTAYDWIINNYCMMIVIPGVELSMSEWILVGHVNVFPEILVRGLEV